MPKIDDVEAVCLAVPCASSPQVTLMDGNDLGVVVCRLLIAKTSNVLQPNDDRVEFHGTRSRRHADKALRDAAAGAAMQVAEGDDVFDIEAAAGRLKPRSFANGGRRHARPRHSVLVETQELRASQSLHLLALEREGRHSDWIFQRLDPLPRGSLGKRFHHVPKSEGPDAVCELMLSLQSEAIQIH